MQCHMRRYKKANGQPSLDENIVIQVNSSACLAEFLRFIYQCKDNVNVNRYHKISDLSLQCLHTYIIGHYNPAVMIIDLVSHITYVVCVNFIHKWRDLQFKVDSERKIFRETFHYLLEHGDFNYADKPEPIDTFIREAAHNR